MMDVAEAEEAARGTDEATKQAGPRDSLAPSCGEAPRRNAPADQEAQGDSAGSVNQPVAQVLPAALGVDTGKDDTSTLPEAVGDTSTSSVVTVKAPSQAPKVGEHKDSNDLPLKKRGVQAPTNVAADSKRPHPRPAMRVLKRPRLAPRNRQQRLCKDCSRLLHHVQTFQPIIPAATSSQSGSQQLHRTALPAMVRSSHGLDAKGERNATGLLSCRQNVPCISVECRQP
ncbi:hypothetical protein HPB51_026320 [Rhipicephalus microplus]|uniref:Uncharacterized protein n=1 Tax=Rhipicephalus microplus TaxID=6941 RepID=A0A9J6D3C0_RHIMP|nr:hypothetical protein HPB51_026320 [Rhipicephalus microplus]